MTHVRRIEPHEARVLRELRLRALADAPEAFGQTLAEAEARLDAEWAQAARQGSRGDGRAWLIAEDVADRDGGRPRPVGLVQARRRAPDTVLVFSMWVDREARRRGVGRLLMEAVEEWARCWGARRTVLWVFAGNESAIRFYQRLGFRAEDLGEDAESGAAYGALAMSRAIDRA